MKVTKSSGEKENYNKNKFCSSLKKAGAPTDLVNTVCSAVEKDLTPDISTSQLFRRASKYLARENANIAARYSLKRGIAELGPAGFIFEQFVEIVLQTIGYKTKRNQMMRGVCVTHEIDIVAQKPNEHFLVEVKYRNKPWIKTHVDVAMYADARLADIMPVQHQKEKPPAVHRMWLVTNTKFTKNAITFAKCKNLKLTGWHFPNGKESLEQVIENNSLYPVTVLPSVNKNTLRALAQKNIMLARDLAPHTKQTLERLGINARDAAKILKESHALIFGK
jgi:hypothetical protein